MSIRRSALIVVIASIAGACNAGGLGAPAQTAPPTTATAAPSPAQSKATLATPRDGNAGFVSPAEAKDLLAHCASLGGKIQAYFLMPNGDTYRTTFPKMGLSPELDGVEGLFVVVYDGPVSNMMHTGIPGASQDNVLQDVLCVVSPTGEATVYESVSREGMNLPPGTVTAGPRP